MNPLDWPTWLKLLAGWGPLAAGWTWAEVRRAREATAHHRTRDDHAKLTGDIHKGHAESLSRIHAITKVHDEHRRSLETQAKEYGEKIQALAETNRRQMTEMFDRCMKLIEQQSAAVSDFVDAVKRRRT